MLIRSQNKEQIVNFDNYNGIAVNYQGERDFNVCAVLEVDAEHVSNVMLGNYSTKERAVRVMDMIERFYAATELRRTGVDVGGAVPEFENMVFGVFQVPQDSEVQP